MAKLTFTIKRSTWSRGINGSQLLYRGNQCCMGFLASACGIANTQLENRARFYFLTPQDRNLLPEELRPIIRNAELMENPLASAFYTTNDGIMPEDDREKRITQMLREIDIDVTFVD